MRAYDIFTKTEMGGHIFNENWFYSASDRLVHPEGRVSYIPNNLHRAATDKLYATGGHLDVFLGTATPPNEEGYMSLSLGLIVQKDLLEAADLKILEVNENLPWTFGIPSCMCRKWIFSSRTMCPWWNCLPSRPVRWNSKSAVILPT